ncbi:hypothetical protein GDO86_020636 [Hymenochirus boettgeri]|uniref:Fibrinogen C-terminal domain-containing protein n=1 Tax=Hymenochirus boettgeri TaxID=247094 RepID=A0A8T2IEZ6_9PIPI|nr:hypothetical protein GDO86_020636 [Hymenochirus boettgeri]
MMCRLDPKGIAILGFVVSVCLVGQVTSKLTHRTREQLYNLLGNRHMVNKQTQFLNVPPGGVALELLAKDCRAAYLRGRRQSGVYVIHPKNSPPLAVYCDLTSDGWIVLQKNTLNKETLWSHNWSQYKEGFGNLTGDHWLGNEMIHLLTRQNPFTVMFSVVDHHGVRRHATYSSFNVDNEDHSYTLRLGDYSGDAGDALTVTNETGIHDNMKFSTADRDNDRWVRNCAEVNKGGWWFDSCSSALFNSDLRIEWRGLCDEKHPCTSSSIMIKPSRKNCLSPGIKHPINILPYTA